MIKQLMPRIYEGETVYSIASRLVLQDFGSSVAASMAFLFQNRNLQLDANLPSYLRILSKHLACAEDELLGDHSLFEFLCTFTHAQVRQSAKDKLIQGDSGSAFRKLGLLASRIAEDKTLRYCPVCAKQQDFAFGESFWLLKHQIPTVSVCEDHLCLLIEKDRQRKQLVFPNLTGAIDYLCQEDVRVKFASMSAKFIKPPVLDSQRLLRCYADKLIQLGFATTKKVHVAKWRKAMQCYFEPMFEDPRINGLFDTKDNLGFPANVFYADSASHHPLKHILIICHLFDSFGTFIVAYELGSVLNPDNNVKKSPSQSSIDIRRTEQTLVHLQSGLSLRQVSKKANVSAATVRQVAETNNISLNSRQRKLDTAIIRAITLKLMYGYPTQDIACMFKVNVSDVEQVLSGQNGIKQLRRRIRKYKRRKVARGAVSRACNDHNASISGIRKKYPADYMWSYKNDKDWLTAIVANLV